MQGKEITAYVNAEIVPEFKNPVDPDKIVKSWAATQAKAEEKKREMEQEYDAIVQIE
jgi:hypothetical protein